MLTTQKKKKLVMPTNFTIILMILVVIIIVSWIPNTADHKLGILDMFYAAIKGFISRADLIVFLLVIGAFLKVTMDSKSLEAGIGRLLAKMKGKEIYFIPLATFIFSLGGTAYGMCEETLAFYPFMMPLLLAAGFDGLTAFMVIMLGSGVGCLAATLDPFALFTAADAINKVSNGAQIAISDGIIWRFIGWVILTGLLIAFITWYAARVKKDKKNSVYGEYYDEHLQKFVKAGEIPELTRKRKWVIGIFITTFVLLIFCIIAWDKFGINVFLVLASVLNGNGNTDNNFVYWAHLHGIGGLGQFWDSANGEFINVTAQNASDAAHQVATFSGAFVLHYDYDGTVHYEITDAFKNFLTSHGYQVN
ncbi:hypothetical protein [Spiroplasma eriocheiris]|uniref:hypothetical protein n=1 Tax=Spiroplasma eriocheiris TaxID=315358 RepID=UPI00069D7F57|nr:hypothetical protein [Spiroplasma eriocheiris]AHF57939.1 putative arginine-ornithine antiporter [Spiroplasma eriocheiris CCTCC M 207170]